MKYTENELNNIIADYNAGLPMKQIAEKYNRDKKAILQKLRSVGVEPRKINSKYAISDDDFEFLVTAYSNGDWSAIQERLPNIPKHKIYHLMSDHNITNDAYFWSEHDKNILKEFYYTIPTEDIQAMLDKHYTIRQIQNQAIKLGLTESREWNSDEVDVLLKHYEHMTGPEIQVLIPKKSVNAIYIKASSLGLRSGYVHEFYYTEEEIKFIVDHWETMSDEEIASCLGKAPHGIADKRHKLGLIPVKLGNAYHDIADYIRHNNQLWRNESMKACDYKCVLSGNTNFEIHHLYSFNLILKEAMKDSEWIIKDIQDYSNEEMSKLLNIFLRYQNKYPLGVCVDVSLHKQFHSIYGNRANYPEQWREFVQIYQYNAK